MYVDDFVVFHNDKRRLTDAQSEIKDFAATLRLKLHEDKSFCAPIQNLPAGMLTHNVSASRGANRGSPARPKASAAAMASPMGTARDFSASRIPRLDGTRLRLYWPSGPGECVFRSSGPRPARSA